MSHMQSLSFKILIFVFACLSIGSTSVKSQDYRSLQNRADSLFTQKKYVQSYQLYDSIYSSGNLSSSQMLLKMAYIQEGLGNYTLALFHLNDYYNQTSDERALEKMQTLGAKHNLAGYDYSESDYVQSLYHQYYNKLVLVLSIVSIIFLAGIFYQKYKLKQKPITNFTLFTLSVLLLAGVINTGMGFKEAIITHPSTYIMSSPSSSSEVLAIIPMGNKVPIKKSFDVWIKTEWDQRTAYVKRKNVTPIASW